ncbi:hypothetical protein T459_22691 [Capsicum annuum]|uniref:Uncharacterized protein n=1 Tax=Capsicum annuum TaxID=4072 RepID=A0A2G2YQ75_CAPAN|nr:hypothetical protein T459_22691 [Capsicum annuum]
MLNPINSGNNNTGGICVGVPDGGIISHSHQEYLGGDYVIKNRSVVRVKYSQQRPFHSRPYQPPCLSAVVNNNNAVGEYVEREKRLPKANPYYKNSEFLLEKDRLPSEINRKLKPNVAGKKDRVSLIFSIFEFPPLKLTLTLSSTLVINGLTISLSTSVPPPSRLSFPTSIQPLSRPSFHSGGMVVGNEGGDGGGTEVDNEIVRPLITRVDDRVRISLSGGNLNIEKIREIRRMLEGEIYQVRSYVNMIEDMAQE